MYFSLWPRGIHLNLLSLRNTVPYLTKSIPSYSLLYPIMKSSPPLPPINPPIFPNPTRDLAGSIGLKENLNNMIITALFASSLPPFPVTTYQEQPAYSDIFYPHPSRRPVKIPTATSHVIVPILDPKLNTLTLTRDPLHSYQNPKSG